MASLLATAVGTMTFEVVAAASLAAVASVAVLGAHCSKRRHGADEASVSPRARKKRRQKKKNVAKNDMQVTVQVSHGVEVNMEPVIAEIKRRAASDKWRHKIVYTFLDDSMRETVNLSFQDVDRAARKVAAALQQTAGVGKGDRVMLCFPPGLDFAVAFWGCLYAGVVGIPVYPPYPGTLAKDLPKFNRLVDDSGAAVVLTTSTYHLATKLATVKSYFSTTKTTSWPPNLQWICTDKLADSIGMQYDETEALSLTHHDIAFFQYSSGSTSAPKAVMISHGNLKAQIKTWEDIEATDTMVSWLPSYHDMGLVGFIIVPCLTAARCVSMSPISFIKDPTIWMRTVSKYKATHVCAPNFGYALAARKTSDQEAATLDLRTLKHTICAAEPIRRESLDAFTSKFQAAGFDPTTFNCGYGLAEVTLVCTGRKTPQKPTVVRVNKHLVETQRQVSMLETSTNENDAANAAIMQLVGCGHAMPTFKVAIVDPETRNELHELQVGEIWVQGLSVAVGYWNRPEYTNETFHAQIQGAQTSQDTYLRTGDMGFLYHGELFVTGRLKDLIIIRGRNVCPQDVEASVERAHENVRPGCTAAFSIEQKDEEALVVVAEVKTNDMLELICREIITIVLAEHQLKCQAVVLLRPKTIPKTTSGKIQRQASKMHFLNGSFVKPLYEYRATTSAAGKENVTSSSLAPKSPGQALQHTEEKTPEVILAWLLDYLAQEMASDASRTTKVDPNTPWAMVGLDSVAIVTLSSDLGAFLGCIVSPSAIFQYETPFQLAHAPGLASGGLALAQDDNSHRDMQPASTVDEIDASCFCIDKFPEVEHLFDQMAQFRRVGLRLPFLETLTPAKRLMVNFNTYNYLGHASDPRVAAAAKSAIDKYGTTMSSSPIVGQTQVNVDLEQALCTFFQADASLLFVGGWVSNVTTIDALVSKGDVILCDALNHDSCVSGQRLSGATILPFPHNDTKALERMLSKLRTTYRRVLIVIEGIYSMDGDLPDVHEFVRLKKQYKALLFIDEAHSFGTLGATGRGICEHLKVNPQDVDIRMGTMSKALGSVGGFILGSQPLITYLKHSAGGFVFSVGLAPACSAAALQSLHLMSETAVRTLQLQEKSTYFYDLCVTHKIPILPQTFRGGPVVVVLIGSTLATAKASEFLAKHKINVKPIVYPAVEEGKCRLRFFISALHTHKQLEETVFTLQSYFQSLTTSLVANGTTTKGAAPFVQDVEVSTGKKRKKKNKKKNPN